MKLSSTAAAVALLSCVASLWRVDAKDEPLATNAVNDALAVAPEATAVLTDEEPTPKIKPDVFTRIAPGDPVVADIVERFETLYAQDMSRSSLRANVSSILKAERTDVRPEMMEKEVDTGGLGIEFMEETQSQRYRVFLLMKYQFDSSMLGRNRPHVTVMRLTMECYNVTVDDPAAPVELACDVLEHADLPRRNESTHSIPPYIQRQIFHSAPASFIHNHSLHVSYDAVEAQDLAFDAQGAPLEDRDTMHYVRFRVQGGSDKDCVIAIEHTDGINTLRYQDTVCYEDDTAAAALAASGSRSSLNSGNTPLFVLLAAILGACVAVLVIWSQRQRQRSGYSYVSSGTSKLSHVPTKSTTSEATASDAAVAC